MENMELGFSIPGKLWWIKNFLSYDMYKGIHNSVIKDRKRIELETSKGTWPKDLIRYSKPPLIKNRVNSVALEQLLTLIKHNAFYQLDEIKSHNFNVHYLEKDADKKMQRTRNRPLPSGNLSPLFAVLYGTSMVVFGSIFLAFYANILTGFLSLLTAFLYIAIYTPLKKITWLNTSIGSIPGAIPIIGGWTAATGEIGTMAWILFGIMYLWQHPHFYAIAWLCKKDYEKANFKMLPVLENSGSRTMRQIFWHLLLMIPVTILPVIQGSLGIVYLIGVIVISTGFFLSAIPLAKDRSTKSALLLLKASVYYLPLLLIIIIIDLGFNL